MDSSAWLAYFQAGSGDAKKLVEDPKSMLFTSVITLHEIKRKLGKSGQGAKVGAVLLFIKERSVVVGISPAVAEKSADDSIKHKLHSIDSLIYWSALEKDSVLVTLDKDFTGLRNVVILKA
jgi:predicted nucleic acid-binding protein